MSKPSPVSPKSRKQRFRESLLARYFVRSHMSLILAATAGAGLLASRFLLAWGVDAPLLRYPLNVVSSYAVFLCLVRLWISYVNNEATHLDTAIEVADEMGLPDLHFSGGGSRLPDLSLPDIDIDMDMGDGDGCAVLAALALLIGAIFACGGFLIYTAPEILTEAAFDAILASSLVKVTNRLERQGWVVGIVRGTAIPFAIVLLVTIGLAYTMHRTCPMASTVREALACKESK